MANSNPNLQGISEYAKSKTEKAIQKVEKSLREMIKKQLAINFNSVSKESGVSKAFLYNNQSLRTRIETLRQQQEGLTSPSRVKRNMSDASKDVLIASLRDRIGKLEKENKELKSRLQIKLREVYEKL